MSAIVCELQKHVTMLDIIRVFQAKPIWWAGAYEEYDEDDADDGEDDVGEVEADSHVPLLPARHHRHLAGKGLTENRTELKKEIEDRELGSRINHGLNVV